MTTATAGTTYCKKNNLYFTFACRNCVNLVSAPIGLIAQAKHVPTAFNSKRRYKNLAFAVHVLHKTLDLVILRCCFAEDGKEMYQESKRTCTGIVLLIKPFVW